MPEKEIAREENPKDHPAWPEYSTWAEANSVDAEEFLVWWDSYRDGYKKGYLAGAEAQSKTYQPIMQEVQGIFDLVQRFPDFFGGSVGDSCLRLAYEKLRKIMTEEGYSE